MTLFRAYAGAFALILAVAGSFAFIPAAHASRPAWLSWPANLSRDPQRVTLPALDEKRRAELEKEGHSVVERLRRNDHWLRADGRVEERIVLARQFLSAEGVRESGTFTFSARAELDQVHIESAYVLDVGGKIHGFDPKLIQVVGSQDQDLFSDVQDVSLPFAGIETGAIAVVVIRWTRDLRQWPLPWSDIASAQSSNPIERLEINVRWDPGVEAPTWKTDAKALRCRQDARMVDCLQEHVPAILPDPDVASWSDLVPQFAFSTNKDWDGLLLREQALLDPPATTPALTKLATSLIGNAVSVRDRAERVFRFVADEIRYVGMEHGRNAVIPRPPTETLQRRFGDCKGKVLLFVTLARAAGLDAFPVLVATRHRQSEKLLVPGSSYFDHVIACVKDGKALLCSDPTDPNLPVGVLGMGTRSSVFLPLRLRSRPARYAKGKPAWEMEVVAENRLGCDGTIHETLRRMFHGASAGTMRAAIPRAAQEQKRWLEEDFAKTMGKAAHPKLSVSGLADKSQSVVITSVTEYPGTTSIRGKDSYGEPDTWLERAGRSYRTDNRNQPFDLAGMSIKSTVAYEVCPNMKIVYGGAKLELRSEYGRLDRTYTVDPSRVTVQSQLRVEPQLVPANKLEDFNQFIDSSLGQARIWFGLHDEEGPAH